ncbi:MAG: PH domain-containing protein [Bacteroidales bacterium]
MNTDFTNSIILPENLPTLHTTPFNPIDRKYITILIVNNLITNFIFIAASWVFFALVNQKINPLFPWMMTILLLFVLGCSLYLALWAFSRRGYLVRERDIAYQRGRLRYRLTSIPFNRIQHVELIQGILAKRLNLASLKVFTAGSGSDDLLIPGLPLETALKIREFLTGKISKDEPD